MDFVGGWCKHWEGLFKVTNLSIHMFLWLLFGFKCSGLSVQAKPNTTDVMFKNVFFSSLQELCVCGGQGKSGVDVT